MREPILSEMATWDVRWLWILLVVSWIGQSLVLGLGEGAEARMTFATSVDICVGLRIAWAWLTLEHSKGSVFYGCLLVLSPAWMLCLAHWFNELGIWINGT